MKTWESGRESKLLDDIVAGRKTVEGRLNRGKFAHYEVGDKISLRRDHRDEDGLLRDGAAGAVHVKVVGIRKYPTFLEMVSAEGYKRVIPDAVSAEAAANEYNKYYPAELQHQHGVLAIEVRVL